MQNLKYSKEELKIAPWLKSYGAVPFHLNYPDYSICNALFKSASKYPNFNALCFEDSNVNYSDLKNKIINTAKAFKKIGIKEGDVVTICLPNIPQTVYSLYALNYIGAVASMVHPLSAVHEIADYLKEVKSKTIIGLDQFYCKIIKASELSEIEHIIIASISDSLPSFKKLAYKTFKEKKFPKVKEDKHIIKWKNFYNEYKNYACDPYIEKKGPDVAVILFSGGTTGTSKAIQLSNINLNALAYQTGIMSHKKVPGSTMLAAMPMFHAFGLAVCIHTMMYWGGRSYLVPQVNVKAYSKLLKKAKPNFIAGVPTLYEGITRNKDMDNVDLSCLRGVFSGGDSLTIEQKKKIDKFLKDHKSPVKVREGYGTTECGAAICLTPYKKEKPGSIGLPFPDTYFGIFKPGTTKPLPFDKEGEICLRGPGVMVGYVGHEEENAKTLVKHPDGYTWLHTGDLGTMDSDGYIYFKQRIKRMIIVSGYNVYPSQVENTINEVPEVLQCCCIGIPDSYKMHKVKAFVVLKENIASSEDLKEKILEHCRLHLSKWAIPREIEFRKSLPQTLIGKVSFKELETQEQEKSQII